MLAWLRGLLAGAGSGAGELEMMTELDSEADWAACLARSESEPVFVFKHSTRCPISSGARAEVVRYIEQAVDGGAPVYINYVVESRPVSNLIAESLGVRHESPQIFLVKGGKAYWHASHGGVRATEMAAAVERV